MKVRDVICGKGLVCLKPFQADQTLPAEESTKKKFKTIQPAFGQ